MVLSGSALTSSHHAAHRRTTSTGWLRSLSTTEAGTVSVQCPDVLLLETINAYQPVVLNHSKTSLSKTYSGVDGLGLYGTAPGCADHITTSFHYLMDVNAK